MTPSATTPALELPSVDQVFAMTHRAGLDRLVQNVLSALVSIVDWRTWETQPYPGHEDEGASHALIAERSGYSVRHIQRAWSQLRELGVEIITEGRLGKTNRYSIRGALPKLMERVRSRSAELADELGRRERRNEGKRPIADPDYEQPRAVPRGNRKLARPDGCPPWLPPHEIPEPWTAGHCVALVVEVGRACFGSTADPEGISGLWRLTHRLWKQRGYGDPEALARDVHRYMRAARECSAPCFQFGMRGQKWTTVGGRQALRQVGQDRVDPSLIKPGKVLAPVPFATALPFALDHERGVCSCKAHDTAPPALPAAEPTPADVELLLEVLQGGVPPAGDGWDIWLPLRHRLRELDDTAPASDVFGLVVEKLTLLRMEDGALVLGGVTAVERQLFLDGLAAYGPEQLAPLSLSLRR